MTSAAAATGRSRWETAGAWIWVLMTVGIAARFPLVGDPARANVYLKVFAPAALAFADGQPLYAPGSGFRYPPLCAALLLPFAWCGPVLGSIVWRLFNVLVLGLGVRATFRASFPQPLSSRERGVFLILLAIANAVSLNNGQPNVLILGLLLSATVGALAGRTQGPALAVAGATTCKVYPFAFGLVLATLRPRLLWWLLPAVVAIVLVPCVLQSPDYVFDQYGVLIDTLRHEDRTGDLSDAYRDLRLLTAAVGAPMPPLLFLLAQFLGGVGIVGFCWRLRARGVQLALVFEYALSLTVCYFMLLGPATEKATYALLGPTLAWPLLRALRARHRGQSMLWITANVLVVLAHVAEPRDRALQAAYPLLRCSLPLAALLATAALIARGIGERGTSAPGHLGAPPLR